MLKNNSSIYNRNVIRIEEKLKTLYMSIKVVI